MAPKKTSASDGGLDSCIGPLHCTKRNVAAAAPPPRAVRGRVRATFVSSLNVERRRLRAGFDAVPRFALIVCCAFPAYGSKPDGSARWFFAILRQHG